MKYFFLLLFPIFLFADVEVGSDVLFKEGRADKLFLGKKIGLVTNSTAINKNCQLTLDRLRPYGVKVIFSPEHGFYGDVYADKAVADGKIDQIPLYSLEGERRRPTGEMLKGINVLVYDIQDIGSRSYTYLSTLFYCMEESAKRGIKFVVLDRPNPLGGLIVDGPSVEEKWRSFLGYINVPYCHGMTVGELAHLFNEEYNVGADLIVIPMKGWKRSMTFTQTGLPWVPTSPQIPEQDTPFFYSTTGLIGHCSLTSVGIGYTLPFKIVGAPWIDANCFAAKLNEQQLPGVEFRPFYFRPFFGKFKMDLCRGINIIITDASVFLPVTTQYTIMGVLKALYPAKFKEAIEKVINSKSQKEVFNKLNGTEDILEIIYHEKYFIWRMKQRFQKDREAFLPIRAKYLNPNYN